MSNTGRPTSPHLSVYRWPITMTLSILHRMTGVALTVGLLLYAAWLMAAASDAALYQRLAELLQTPVGHMALIGWSFAFFFHLCNGVRHLFWDAGWGFGKRQATTSAWMVVLSSIGLTALYWWLP